MFKEQITWKHYGVNCRYTSSKDPCKQICLAKLGLNVKAKILPKWARIICVTWKHCALESHHMDWSHKMSAIIWQINRYECKTYWSVGRVWVTGEEVFFHAVLILNKLIIWTTQQKSATCQLFFIGLIPTFLSLTSTFSLFMNSGLCTSLHALVHLLSSCHVPGIFLQEDLLCFVLLIVMLCSNLSTNSENT